MKWKTVIYATVVWFLVSLSLGGGMFWYIAAHPMGPQIDEVRFEKATEATGELAGWGLGLTWLALFARAMVLKLQSEMNKPGSRSS